jgi:outer membrane immunogenic protein
MKSIAHGAICAAFCLSPAAAADFPIKARAPAPVVIATPWTGFYVGIEGGYGSGRDVYNFPPTGGFGGVVAPFGIGGNFEQRFNGGVFGGHLGFNYQIGNFVVGLEGSIASTRLRGSSANVLGPFFPGTTTYDADLHWVATVTPRLGIAVDNWLLYGKGGLAAGRVETRVANSFFPLTYSEQEHYVGWTAGAGVEYAVTANWIVGLEYNYYNLGSERYGGLARVAAGTISGEYHVDYRHNSVLGRLSYKWDAPSAVAPAPYPRKAPVYAAVGMWTGLYFGGHGGYGWGNADNNFPFPQVAPFGPVTLTGGSFSQRIDGGIGGGHLGYNQQWGNWVVGLEGSISGTDIKGSTQDPFLGAPGVPPPVTYETKVRWLATLTPRLGVASDSWLFYGKGGVAAGRIQSNLASTGFGILATSNDENEHVGWTIGGGIEHALTPNWILGIEYDYYDLGTQHYGGIGSPPGQGVANYDVRVKFGAVLGRLSYKLGNPVVVAKN